MNNLTFYVSSRPFYQFDVYIRRGENRAVQLTSEVDCPEGAAPPVSMTLTPDEAQNLIEALWAAGIRPRNGESSLAHVASIKDHLNDMRAIVANKLNITIP